MSNSTGSKRQQAAAGGGEPGWLRRGVGGPLLLDPFHLQRVMNLPTGGKAATGVGGGCRPGGCAAPLMHVHAHLKSRWFQHEADRVLQRPPGLRRRSCLAALTPAAPYAHRRFKQREGSGTQRMQAHGPSVAAAGGRQQGGSHSVAGEGAEPVVAQPIPVGRKHVDARLV